MPTRAYYGVVLPPPAAAGRSCGVRTVTDFVCLRVRTVTDFVCFISVRAHPPGGTLIARPHPAAKP